MVSSVAIAGIPRNKTSNLSYLHDVRGDVLPFLWIAVLGDLDQD